MKFDLSPIGFYYDTILILFNVQTRATCVNIPSFRLLLTAYLLQNRLWCWDQLKGKYFEIREKKQESILNVKRTPQFQID